VSWTEDFTNGTGAFQALSAHTPTPDSALGPWLSWGFNASKIYIGFSGGAAGCAVYYPTDPSPLPACMYASGVQPNSQDYSVDVVWKMIAFQGALTTYASVLARLAPASIAGTYGVRVQGNGTSGANANTIQYDLFKINADGTRTVVASTAPEAKPANGATFGGRLDVSGNRIRFYKSTDLATPVIDFTDPSPTLRAGYMGILIPNSSAGTSSGIDITSVTLNASTGNPPATTEQPTIAVSGGGAAVPGATLQVGGRAHFTGDPTISITDVIQRNDSGTWVDLGAATYLITQADTGKQFRVKETAANSAGSVTVFSSNTITAVSVPVNTAPPTITTDGTPQIGETITGVAGTWDYGPVTAHAYEWQRSTDGGGSWTVVRAKGSDPTYQIQSADGGELLRVREWATNATGESQPAASGVVSVIPPIGAGNVNALLSGGTGNTDPELSLGGAQGGAVSPVALHNLFADVLGSEAAGGLTDYRLVYWKNTHPTDPVSIAVYIDQQLPVANESIALGVPTEPAGTDVAAIATRTTAPPGVSFSSPTDIGSSLDLGDIGPGEARGLWIERHIEPNSSPRPSNPFRVRAEVTPL
jgi:hypothetical protein